MPNRKKQLLDKEAIWLLLNSIACNIRLIDGPPFDQVWLLNQLRCSREDIKDFWGNSKSPDMDVLVAPCKGGSYYYFGKVFVRNDRIYLHLKTERGILTRSDLPSKYEYELADPDALSEIDRIIKEFAPIALNAFKLEHKRACQRRDREINERAAS